MRYIHHLTEYDGVLYTSQKQITKPIKCDNIPKFYLLV